MAKKAKSDSEPVAEPVSEETPEGQDSNPEELDENPFAELESKVHELEDKLLRARADYDNLQKRHARDAELERERQKARILEPFLQVFEFAQMAAKEAEKQPGSLSEGVKMLVREFERHLDEQGLRPFGAVGDAFDPNLHEATGELETDGVDPGAVSTVIRQGYRLGERVLRYAKVTVQPEATDSN